MRSVSDIMFPGSMILCLLCLWLPKNLILIVCIPLIVIEIMIAIYWIWGNQPIKRLDGKVNKTMMRLMKHE